MSTKPWRCAVCSQPIDGAEGSIIIRDPETKGMPEDPPEPPQSVDDDGVHGIDLGSAAASVVDDVRLRRLRLEVVAVHDDCDKSEGGYWFSAQRAATLEAWCGWVSHLCGKKWITTYDVRNLLDNHVARGAGDLLLALVGLALAFALCGFLYRRRIFLRL